MLGAKDGAVLWNLAGKLDPVLILSGACLSSGCCASDLDGDGEVTHLELQNAINMQDRMHMSLTRQGRPRVATALDVVATARLKGAAGRWRARGLAAAGRASSDAREGRPV